MENRMTGLLIAMTIIGLVFTIGGGLCAEYYSKQNTKSPIEEYYLGFACFGIIFLMIGALGLLILAAIWIEDSECRKALEETGLTEESYVCKKEKDGLTILTKRTVRVIEGGAK